MRLTFALLLSSLLALPFSSQAMTLTLKKACDEEKDCQYVALGQGDIEADTVASFVDFYKTHPDVHTIYLNSLGGSLKGGMELGMHLRAAGWDTVVGDDMLCASACAYAFMGGFNRSVEGSGAIGLHQFTSEKEGDWGVGQKMVALLDEYVESMGVSTTVLRIAAQQDPDHVAKIDHDDALELNLDNNHIDDLTWSVLNGDKVSLLRTHGKAHGSDRETVVSIGKADTKVLVHIMFKEPTFNSELHRARENEEPTLYLCKRNAQGTVDTQHCVITQATKGWEKAQEGEDLYDIGFVIPEKEFAQLLNLSSTDTLCLAVVGGNEEDTVYSVKMYASAEGFKRGFSSL